MAESTAPFPQYQQQVIVLKIWTEEEIAATTVTLKVDEHIRWTP